MELKFRVEKSSEQRSFSSQEERIADKFKQWVVKKGIEAETLDSEEAINIALSKSHVLMPGINPQDVINELKKMGVLYVPPVEKKSIPVVNTKIETEFVKLSGLKEVQDENLQKILEENKFFEELKKDIFKNDKDLDDVLEKSLLLGRDNLRENIETIEYYNQFADAGLIKGGREEVKNDFQGLIEREEIFKNEKESLELKQSDKKEKSKKIATIVERAVSYGVSDLGWYGDNVSLETTSKFDDVKRRTDEVLEIRKGEDESNFMGLGIDVTFRGLLSESYKEKFFTLLDSIQNGYKTKIKYFKNHKGQMMREFAVPKIILFFNIDDVKDLVYMIKNIDDPKVKEEFKNSPQKFKVMNQMLIQCEILASFAEESKNSIFRQYVDIISSIKELAWNNRDVKKILDERHEDEVSHHMKYLINEFKKQKKI